MLLRLESRPVGEVLIVQAHGRIVVGREVNALHNYIQESMVRYVDIVLDLAAVEFIDSSGLGALVRLKQAAHAKGGDLKLARLPEFIRKTMQMTNLLSQFASYATVEEAITAAYLGPRYSGDSRPRIVCVHGSTDVATFLREVLCGAGYNALTAANVSEAQVVVKATQAKLVVIPAHMQSVYGRPAQQVLQEVDPAISLFILEENFANQDPGESAAKLLNAIGAVAKPASSAAPGTGA